MKLDAARPGQPLTVLGPGGATGDLGAPRLGDPADASARRVSLRLAELGVRPGARLRILSRTSGGGAILALGDDRLAVSRQILASIEVSDEVPAHG